MNTSEEQLVIEQTLNWVKSFVIEYNLCPFAKKAVNTGGLRIAVSSHQKSHHALDACLDEIRLLDDSPRIETTLLVFNCGFKDFFTYLDLVELAEQLIHKLDYEGVYQIASFHPNYYFADTTPDDVTNYTNRSPYPMIHFLREDNLEKAIKVYGNTDEIPENNRLTMRQLGLEKLKGIG